MVRSGPAMRWSGPAAEDNPQAAYRNSSSTSGAGRSTNATNSSSGGRFSSASSSTTGSVAAKKRLSMTDTTGPPPFAVKPYLAGPAVAAFVGKRATQKADLVHYLESHKSSVCRVMSSGGTSDPGQVEAQSQQQQQQPQEGGGNFVYNSSTGSSSSGAYSNTLSISGSIRAQSDSFCNSSTSNGGSGSGTSYTMSSQVSPDRVVSPEMASPASARRASLTAYLQGRQDLVTTVTTGAPYADGTSPCSTYRQSVASVGISAEGNLQYRASNCYSEPLSQQHGTVKAPAAAAADCRHTLVKETLSARLSDAAARANPLGDKSPRIREEVSGLRSMLLAEGRARRASATAVGGGSSSSPTQQAAAMIARRISNSSIYPAAYDHVTVGRGSQQGFAGENTNHNHKSSTSNVVLQQSWESIAFDENGRQRVGEYNSCNINSEADRQVHGGSCSAAAAAIAGITNEHSDSGSSSSSDDTSQPSRRSDDSSASDESAFGVSSNPSEGLLPGLGNRRSSISKRGGWKAAGKAARALMRGSSSNAGNNNSIRVCQLSQLSQPRMTRAISKPYRSASLALGKAAAARRISLNNSLGLASASGCVKRSSSSSRRATSRSSSDASKTDILELARRSSITTTRGQRVALSRTSSSSSSSDSNNNMQYTHRRSSSNAAVMLRRPAATAAARDEKRRKSLAIQRKLLLRLRHARSSSSSSGSSSSSDDSDSAVYRQTYPAVKLKPRQSNGQHGALPSWEDARSRYSRLPAMRRSASGLKASLRSTGKPRASSSSGGDSTHGANSSSSSSSKRLSAALEALLNPHDKPTHRLSCSAGDAAAVVMGSAVSNSNSDDSSSTSDDDWEVHSDDSSLSAMSATRRGGTSSNSNLRRKPSLGLRRGSSSGLGRPGLRKTWSKVYRQAARSSIAAAAASNDSDGEACRRRVTELPRRSSMSRQQQQQHTAKVSHRARAPLVTAAGVDLSGGRVSQAAARVRATVIGKRVGSRDASGSRRTAKGSSEVVAEASWVTSVVRRLSGVSGLPM